ncbi:DNA invertase Pin-like site-specific DNA recombinase [Yoonia maricola]|uniref:DNA invertase Pin-like site-specific DNA recombinase n=1 Tax=Yoonia maricola TaxID=420999 RepID=A0A2M8WK25_9RHOB|nr:recombinase family protein [Yoonia maricola]PJI91280.1 DNA invertase Pin-like site-specific DNA recombinase [Yoonia maricola]
MRVAYRRVSTTDQNLDRQLVDQIDIEKVFEDKLTGASRERPGLNEMMAFCREGDCVVVHSLDRLGRDIRDLLNIVEELNAKGVAVEFVSERLKFSDNDDDPLARLQLHMLAAFAQWERNIAKQRQAEGIARAKAVSPDKYQGRPVSIDTEQINALKAQGLGATAIAKRMRIGRASVYRHLKAVADTRSSRMVSQSEPT